MASDSGGEEERRRIEELLKRQASPEGRRPAGQERHREASKSAEIARARQEKLERVDAKRRADQLAQRAKASQQAHLMADGLAKAAADAERRFLRNLCQDWGRRLGHYQGARPPYTGTSEWGGLTPEELLRVAGKRRPVKPGNRVTDFADWVFSLEHPSPNPGWRATGKKVEANLLNRADRAKDWLRRAALHSKNWRILFEDDQTGESRTFCISALTVGQECLVGKPDLVLEELRSGSIFIIERKASNRPIPTNCWHNVRAQLWAYAQIDDWVDRPSLTLVAEVWRYSAAGRPTDSQVFSWGRGDVALAAGIQPLFDTYRRTDGA